MDGYVFTQIAVKVKVEVGVNGNTKEMDLREGLLQFFCISL